MNLLKFHPILFQPEMVVANIEGRKTETRRTKGLETINLYPEDWLFNKFEENPEFVVGVDKFDNPKIKSFEGYYAGFYRSDKSIEEYAYAKCPYGQPGDILWLRETYFNTGSNEYLNKETNLPYCYQADVKDSDASFVKEKMAEYGWKYKPCIHMPKEACRIFLLLKEVKVERLHYITEEEAKAEGVQFYGANGDKENWRYYGFDLLKAHSAKKSFESLWQSINEADSWQQNPFVWVLKYEVLTTNGYNDLMAKLIEKGYHSDLVIQSLQQFVKAKK